MENPVENKIEPVITSQEEFPTSEVFTPKPQSNEKVEEEINTDLDFISDASHTKPNDVKSSPIYLFNNKYIRNDIGEYCRVGDSTVKPALVDEGMKIRFIDKQLDTFQAGVELAKSKGWSSIQVSGSEKFKSEAWFHAKMAGMDVIGYEPSSKDVARLKSSSERANEIKAGENASQDFLDSKLAAEEYVLKTTGSVLYANTEKGQYIGRLTHETSHHFVQHLGKDVSVIHEKSKSEDQKKLAIQLEQSNRNSPVKIQYNEGQAHFVAKPEKSKAHTR